jgi:hypothetical protein
MSVRFKAVKRPVCVEVREVRGETETIQTLNGPVTARQGQDFIIKGVNGEEYPIDKEIFEKTYFLVDAKGTLARRRYSAREHDSCGGQIFALYAFKLRKWKKIGEICARCGAITIFPECLKQLGKQMEDKKS